MLFLTNGSGWDAISWDKEECREEMAAFDAA